MPQSEVERTLSYVPDSGATLRYSLAVPLLMVVWDRRGWLLFVGLLASAAWWALVGVQRQQSDWWLGFVIASLAAVLVYAAFAVAVFGGVARRPIFPADRLTSALLTPDLITFDLAPGIQRIRRIDIDRMGGALGFVILGARARGVFWIVPRQLIPSELVTEYRTRSVGATA